MPLLSLCLSLLLLNSCKIIHLRLQIKYIFSMATNSRVKNLINIAETTLKRYEFNKICKSLLIFGHWQGIMYDELRTNAHTSAKKRKNELIQWMDPLIPYVVQLLLKLSHPCTSYYMCLVSIRLWIRRIRSDNMKCSSGLTFSASSKFRAHFMFRLIFYRRLNLSPC